MPKPLIKSNHPKNEAAGTHKTKGHKVPEKNLPFIAIAGKKNAANLLWLLNYKYQDSDLEQFVY